MIEKILNTLKVHYLKTMRLLRLTTNDVTIKLHEQGLITKECIAMHTN